MQHSMHIKVDNNDFMALRQDAKRQRISISALVRQKLFTGLNITMQDKPRQDLMPAIEKPISTETIECRRCKERFEVSKGTTEKIPLQHGGFHIRLSCPACNNFIKFLKHEPVRIYWGKHAGKSIDEIKKEDPEYLRWIVENSKGLDDRTKTKIKEILNG